MIDVYQMKHDGVTFAATNPSEIIEEIRSQVTQMDLYDAALGFVVERTQMTQEAFDALPEFEGW